MCRWAKASKFWFESRLLCYLWKVDWASTWRGGGSGALFSPTWQAIVVVHFIMFGHPAACLFLSISVFSLMLAPYLLSPFHPSSAFISVSSFSFFFFPSFFLLPFHFIMHFAAPYRLIIDALPLNGRVVLYFCWPCSPTTPTPLRNTTNANQFLTIEKLLEKQFFRRFI